MSRQLCESIFGGGASLGNEPEQVNFGSRVYIPNEVFMQVADCFLNVRECDSGEQIFYEHDMDMLKTLRLVHPLFKSYLTPKLFETVILPSWMDDAIERMYDLAGSGFLCYLEHLAIPLDIIFPRSWKIPDGKVEISEETALLWEMELARPLYSFLRECLDEARLPLQILTIGQVNEGGPASHVLALGKEPAYTFFGLIGMIFRDLDEKYEDEFSHDGNLYVGSMFNTHWLWQNLTFTSFKNLHVSWMPHDADEDPMRADEIDWLMTEVLPPELPLESLQIDGGKVWCALYSNVPLPSTICKTLTSLQFGYFDLSGDGLINIFRETKSLETLELYTIGLDRDDSNFTWADIFRELPRLERLERAYVGMLHYSRQGTMNVLQEADPYFEHAKALHGVWCRPLHTEVQDDYDALRDWMLELFARVQAKRMGVERRMMNYILPGVLRPIVE